MSLTSLSPGAPSRQIPLADWLLTGWRLALRHFPALVVISLVSDLPLSLIRALAEDVDNAVVSFLAGAPAIALVTPLAKAAAIVAIDRWDRGESGALRAAFAAVARHFPGLFAASLLWAVAVFAGAVLLIVPGVIILVLGQCLMGAIILEGRPLRDAARRSLDLVGPRFLSVLALFVIIQVTVGAASSLLEAGLGRGLSGWPLDILVSALLTPFALAPLAVLFLRSRSEADASQESPAA